MVTLVDLKERKRDTLEKILLEEGRDKVISFSTEVLDKRAYFTIDIDGKIKRKDYTYILDSAVFIQEDNKFLDFMSEAIDFRELINFDKIGRMTNATDKELEKNILKCLAKGEIKFLLKPLKELYMRNEKKFFEILFNFSLMDNIKFKKALSVYSLKKYFEKYGYSDEALYLTVSYLAKVRADFYEYENASELASVTKDELRDIVKKNIDKFKNKKGLEIISYLLALLQNNYNNDGIYINIIKNNIDKFLNTGVDNTKSFTNVEEEIFINLIREV